MSTRNNLFAAAAGLLLAGWLLAGPVMAAPVPLLKAGSVKIENTGSTNTPGYTLYVSPDGIALLARAAGPLSTAVRFEKSALPKAQVQSLFKDLAAAGPLSALPARHGMRSASFGTSTYLTYKGQRSPNLTFPGNAQAQALRDDIAAIVRTCHLGGSRLMRPALPANN